jgi:hypothetical protein
MSHARTQIRAALVTRLTGLATTGSRVFGQRYHDFADTELPGLRVFAEDETVLDPFAKHRSARQVPITVECCAKQLATIDDVLDQITLEVEIAVAADQTLGNLVRGGCKYAGIGEFRVEDGGEKPVGVWPMRFIVDYDVNPAAPQTLL